MNNYIALTKVLLKNGSSSLNGDKKKRIKTIVLFFIIVGAFTPTIILLLQFISKAYDLLFDISQQGVILALGISFTCIFIFFFGILYSQNVLYFANDIDMLLSLPFKQSQILGAKFTVALVYEYFTEAILFLPLLIVYGVKSQGSFVYYFYGLILFLSLPIVPLSLASLINMIIMSFTNIGRHKDKLKILGGIGGMILGVGFNLWMQKLGMSTNNPEKMLTMLKSENSSLMTISNKAFPGSYIASKALVLSNSFQGFINMILFLGITLLIVLVFLALGEKLYFKGVVGISEAYCKRKELTFKELTKSATKSSPVTALTIRELRILFRTPIYFINCILMNFLWPVFLLIPILTQPELTNNIRQATVFAKDPKFTGLIAGIALAGSLFLSCTNAITSTAISREGKNLFIIKYIPVSYAVQLTAKLLSGIIMGTIAIIMPLLIGGILIKPPVYLPIIILISSIPAIVFISIIGILIDLNFPKLNWDNEVKAVKQNFNVFITLLIGMVLAGVIAYTVIKFEEYAFIVTIVISLVLVIIDLVLYRFTMKKGSDILNSIES